MRDVTTKDEAKAYVKTAAIAITICVVILGGWALVMKVVL